MMTTPARKHDSPIGVCARIGEDLGFNPDWLRVVLAVGLLWNAGVMLAIYAGLGAVVLSSRLLFPDRRTAPPVLRLVAPATAPRPEPVVYAEAA